MHTTSIQKAQNESNLERLQRLADWCKQGQRAAAELELHDWQRHENCPAVARVLLVSLLATREDWSTARDVLRRATHQHITRDEADVNLLQLRIAFDDALDISQGSSRWVRTLHERFGHDVAIIQWLNIFTSGSKHPLPETSQAAVQQLSRELTGQPLVIPSIVHAQMIKPDAPTIDLLRQALTLATRELLSTAHAVATCQALAQLAILAEDADDARRWAHRGLKISPLNASLALVLAKIEDDAHVGSPALTILQRVHEAQPQYPDLHAALIRREFANGDADSARMRLHHWLDKDPQNPMAQQLKQELAA